MLTFLTKAVVLAVVSGCLVSASRNNSPIFYKRKPNYTNYTLDFESIDWCESRLHCDDGLIENTMCTGTKIESRGECYFMQDEMNSENRRVLLAYHNSFRDELASGGIPGWPPSGNMRQLRWDTILEKQATTWAYQCQPGLDPCPANPMTLFVGQAIFNLTNNEGLFFDADPIFAAMINHSAPEVVSKGMDGNASLLRPPNPFTNFVQVVFAQQTRVGCSLIQFLQNSPNKLAGYGTKLTCFYAQETDKSEENAIGYTEGPPCSSCPAGSQCNPKSSYKHLCSSPEDPLYDSYSIVFSVPVSKGRNYLPTAFLVSSCLLMSVSHRMSK